MPEVSHPGEQHGYSQTVSSFDHFRIALRAAGLDDGGRSGFRDLLHAIGERKERVGSGDGSVQRQLCFHGSDPGSIHAAHLSGADSDRLAIAGVDDRV